MRRHQGSPVHSTLLHDTGLSLRSAVPLVARMAPAAPLEPLLRVLVPDRWGAPPKHGKRLAVYRLSAQARQVLDMGAGTAGVDPGSDMQVAAVVDNPAGRVLIADTGAIIGLLDKVEIGRVVADMQADQPIAGSVNRTRLIGRCRL